MHYQNDHLRIFVIALFTWIACFIKPLIGDTYTSWDTHDLGFVNFLYFSDALRSGYLPLWNHFIQSGTFFPQFFNVGIFSPFQLLFVFLSWLISPVYAYELMLQAIVLAGGIGTYLVFRAGINDRLIALFGATAFAVGVLLPATGQTMFLFSFSSFPWILLACIKIIQNRDKGFLRFILWGILIAMYMSSGYVWMNFINMSIAVVFAIVMWMKDYRSQNKSEKKLLARNFVYLLAFFSAITLVYCSFELPGYLSMQFNYSLFNGDYSTPEPHLRSLKIQAHYSYSNIYKAMVGAIDPRIAINNELWQADLPKWSWGSGWALCIIFFVILTRRFFWQQIFWLALLVASLIYAAGDSNFAGKYIEATPILNANRWWFCGVFYTTICLVFLAIPRMAALKDIANNRHSSTFFARYFDFQLLLVGSLSIYLLWLFNSSVFEFVLVSIIVLLIALLSRAQTPAYWKNLLTILILVNVLALAYMPYSISEANHYLIASGTDGYATHVQNREKNIVITKNFRRLGEGGTYVFNDEEWLLKKIPFSHGYNPLGNPLYWYVKNEPFFNSIVVATQSVRKEKNLQRQDFASDNEFASALMNDVLVNPSVPTIDTAHFESIPINADFKWALRDLNITPNTVNLRVETNSASYLVLNNTYAPGWKVSVNGVPTDIVNTNHIFQGVLLNKAGIYDVEFKYRPQTTIMFLLLPYFLLMLCFGLFSVNLIRQKRINSLG